MRIERLGELGSAPAVFSAVAGAAERLGMPAPAALIGDWFGSRAVIAPTVTIGPVDPSEVFSVPPPRHCGDAIGGGWLGYQSYPDAAADGAACRVPEAAGGWVDGLLRLDRTECWWYETLSDQPMHRWVSRALLVGDRPSGCEIRWDAPDRDHHRAGVLACLDAIAAGEIYQACVCTQFTGAVTGSASSFFADGVARTTPARAAFLAGTWGAVASLSPELFLRRRGHHVTSSPIKGTLPRHADPSALRRSVKDVAENIMIVDLVRNDLGRVATTGTVTVPELLAVHPAPGVWHLVSTVSARVPTEVPTTALLDAAFPPASVTGTPKTRARQLIAQWEQRRRGIFCGTIGLASPVAGMELSVAIRTVEFDDRGGAVLGVGGGITADSDPDAEWDECLHKAAPIVGSAQLGYALARSTAS